MQIKIWSTWHSRRESMIESKEKKHLKGYYTLISTFIWDNLVLIHEINEWISVNHKPWNSLLHYKMVGCVRIIFLWIYVPNNWYPQAVNLMMILFYYWSIDKIMDTFFKLKMMNYNTYMHTQIPLWRLRNISLQEKTDIKLNFWEQKMNL